MGRAALFLLIDKRDIFKIFADRFNHFTGQIADDQNMLIDAAGAVGVKSPADRRDTIDRKTDLRGGGRTHPGAFACRQNNGTIRSIAFHIFRLQPFAFPVI